MYQWVQQLQGVQGDQVCLGDLQYLNMLSHIWMVLNEIECATISCTGYYKEILSKFLA